MRPTDLKVRDLEDSALLALMDTLTIERDKRFRKAHTGRDLFKRLKDIPTEKGHEHKFSKSPYYGGMSHNPPKVFSCDCG